MTDHSKALVPLESWCYNSPELLYKGIHIDMGLMAEALIYYDQIFINTANQPQFSSFLSWFVRQGKYNDLLNLFDDGTIKIYDYSFASAAVEQDGVYMLVNIQDEIQKQENTFERRYLYHDSIKKCLPKSRDRERLYNILRGKAIEAKAADFGNAIENAREDYKDPQRSSLLIQAFIDEVYPFLGLGKPPLIKAVIDKNGDIIHIHWNVDIVKLSEKLGRNLNLHLGTPLAGIGNCNRLLHTSADLNCDLYLGRPMSSLVGNKLYEIGCRTLKSSEIIDKLQVQVDFPDIRGLVNEDELNLDDILKIRKKAKKFRTWLQQEGERDRDAIIAYHHEISKEAGLTKFGNKSLQILGFITGPTAGALVGSAIGGVEGAVAGSIVGKGSEYLFNLGKRMTYDWRPVVFGNWLRQYIDKILDK